MAMFDVIIRCMVSIFCGECLPLFANNKAVLPDSHENHVPDNTQISPLDNLLVVDGPLPLPDLPTDIIADIFGRLPAKCIFSLQRDSQALYDLTTTPLFTRTHLNRATSPCIVVQSLTLRFNSCIKIFLFDENSENRVEAISLDLRRCDAYCWGKSMILFDSYDGFLLFKDDHSRWPVFCIWNPITKQQVIVTSRCSHYYVCGLYFHPRKKEYELLYVCFIAGRQNEFYILCIRTNQRRRAGSGRYRPSNASPAVILNGTLHWMVDRKGYFSENHVFPSLSNSILSFNIETEELSTMEAVMPFDDILTRFGEQLQLFEMKGDLCLFDPSSMFEVLIWVFNYMTKCWVKAHSAATVSKTRRKTYFWQDDAWMTDYIRKYHWMAKRVILYILLIALLYREGSDLMNTYGVRINTIGPTLYSIAS
ncbi:hypothetical protein C5167_021094 [Papaver somniferum]|uniref:F-box domain-containing protein n=1 Tax=Papaver somniferum TaxID=3469 RepID=A0A4Y7IYT6_PAPSO|nr:hypothetical protein C5167_021094 [Papaver somniferum]